MIELVRALAARCDLLGIEAQSLALLAIDSILLAAVAGGLVGRLERASNVPRWGVVRTLLASGLVLVATVVASATLLGAAGRLSAPNLMAVHALLLTLLVAAEWSRGQRVDPRALVRWALRPLAALAAPLRAVLAADGWRRERRSESALLAGLLGVLGFYLVLALFTPPFNWDSNTYRLSRVATWLQEGSLDHYPTNDPRQNWVGQNAELVMLWLTGFFRREYPLVKLAQWGGGILACLAVHQLAGWLGMSRLWRLVGAAALVGMPTVATQFISSQTDLFTAGCLAAGLAFLPGALSGPRRGEWLLVGAGYGLALGAKATVLYWAPGLALLVAGWAWTERASLRSSLRGVAVAATVAVPLCGYNFALNSVEIGSPLAPRQTVSFHGSLASPEPAAKVTTGLVAIAWQLFEPHSNPLLPASLHAPVFDFLLDWLAERRHLFGQLRRLLAAEGGWQARGLNEDEASYGLMVAFAAALGGIAAVGAALRGRDPDRQRAALVAVALLAFLVVYSALSVVGPTQYRYFCVPAPFVALLAADLFARWRRLFARALVALFVVAQIATAIYVGVASRNQGLRVLRDPAAGRMYPFWSDSRGVAQLLGERPLAVGLVLQGDSWLAPLLRSGVAHRWRQFESADLDGRSTVGSLLREHRLDVLVADPYLLRTSDVSDLRVRHAPSAVGWRRALYDQIVQGRALGPRALAIEGLHGDRWSAPYARFRLADWRSGRLELAASNPTPLAREVVLHGRRGSVRIAFPPGAKAQLSLAVAERDVVTLDIDPPFVPREHGMGVDVRELGLLLEPLNVVAREGVYADDWTEPKAAFSLHAWMKGFFEIEVANPTPLARRLRVESSLQRASWELPPGSRRVIAIAVAPADRVALEVSPPFVPSRHGLGEDDRELGVFVGELPGGG